MMWKTSSQNDPNMLCILICLNDRVRSERLVWLLYCLVLTFLFSLVILAPLHHRRILVLRNASPFRRLILRHGFGSLATTNEYDENELIGYSATQDARPFSTRILESHNGIPESVSKSRVFSSSTGYLTVTFTSDGAVTARTQRDSAHTVHTAYA
jgi:hypothetical protein